MAHKYSSPVDSHSEMTITDLKDCMKSMSRQNLITEAERKEVISRRGGEIEKKVFRLLMQKDLYSSLRMLEALKNGTVGEDYSDPDQRQLSADTDSNPSSVFRCDHPLKIPLIVHNLFQYLNLEDTKNCRYVCKEWSRVSENFLRKRAQVTFGYPRELSCLSRTMANFHDAFRFSYTNVPFTAMQLTNLKNNNAIWPKSALKELLHDWGNNLKELNINLIRVRVSSDAQLPFNISNYFPQPNCITKLKIFNDSSINRRFKISLSKIPHVKYLLLTGCTLSLNIGFQISPIELDIKKTSILFPTQDKEKILNRYFDIRSTEKFTFHSADYGEAFDLAGSFELDVLDLEDVDLLNWTSSNFKINQLLVSNEYWHGRSNIIVKEMEVDDSLELLDHIPRTVEKLRFQVLFTDYNSDAVLSHLKHLNFFSYGTNLNCFQNCNNLTTLNLERVLKFSNRVNPVISLDRFPPNLRKLIVHGSMHQYIHGHWQHLPLETLILNKCPVSSFKTWLRLFQPKETVIELSKTKGDHLSLTEFLSKTDKSIYIGKFWWPTAQFDNSSFSTLVNKSSEYYLFNDRKGIAISEDKYKKIMEL